jgi:hypothetical protein
MKRLHVLWQVVIPVFLCGVSPTLFSQNVDMSPEERQALAYEQELDSLRVQHARWMNQAEIIARHIELYRSKGNLNARDHRNLEKQLQESQRLESAVLALEARINEVINDYRDVIRTLIPLYRARIDSLLDLAKGETSTEKQALLAQAQELLTKKQAWDAQLLMPIRFTHTDYKIVAHPWDTQRQLMMKGDLLLDQEDALRREIDVVDERIQSLQKEKKIRTKMAELTEDLDLFNEREELLGREAEGIETGANDLIFGERDTDEGRSYEISGIPESWGFESSERTLNRPVDLVWTPRSPVLIQESIDRLRRFRSRITTQADSLRQRAEWFHEEAQKR